ncbi:lipoate--protein ligase [Bdellovibrio bacteriovorus]
MQLKVFLSDSLNPHLNLATEEWIFNNLEPDQHALFLWRNEDTILIGRNQNPWSECNLLRMVDDKVHLARRTTGGGAVFHDLGNTNFSFLSPKQSYNLQNNTQIIFQALEKFGVKGETSGRNDLLFRMADGYRKFSGSAYREKKDRIFHHGTLLLNTNIQRLRSYLLANPKRQRAFNLESTRARIANLSEIAKDVRHEKMVEAMIASFQRFYSSSSEIECLTASSLLEIPELKSQYESLTAWEWLYGNTLEFNHHIQEYLSLGAFEIQFKVRDGFVKDLRIYTNCLYPTLVEEITEALMEKPYDCPSVIRNFEPIISSHPELESGLRELRAWICQTIN